jgi:hypothetical protein
LPENFLEPSDSLCWEWEALGSCNFLTLFSLKPQPIDLATMLTIVYDSYHAFWAPALSCHIDHNFSWPGLGSQKKISPSKTKKDAWMSED